ncbi:SDR family NAD(P)-dependent oxidoreductase [Deinococcus apachensis]|uniref:SDR family NAD(P)-dependent oxidoreductase n=1 Tax=Deinococcus apachensis TaxID=309886 RepID=UPI00036D09D2|nr:SDR family NAD(P)-dependent oxidoreductase [Deinococcus apachensis]
MRLPTRLILAAGLGAIAARNVLKSPYDLGGKSVLITGSRGLGLALAREFSARGARLMLVARDEDELARAAASLRASGATIHTISGDLTDQADIERIVEEAARVYGGLDVLVNNAGLIQVGPLENMTEADFREIMEINAFAPLRLTRAALPLLRARRGRVLIVSSIGGKVAVPHLAPYSMSKFAVTGLGQALRAELAREGVGVTTVCPWLMQTGSARHASVKGQQAKEYALFATMDNLPLLSLDAETAARRMVTALVRGEAEVMVGGLALLLRYAQALAPGLTADLLALGNRLLPGPTTSSGSLKGAEVETPVTRNNPLKRAAEQAYNEG